MKILVTGGAGYIGSVAVKRLVEENHDVVVIDNLSKGMRELVNPKAKFIEGDLLDKHLLEEIFSNNKFDSVIHFAAYKDAGESMKKPEKYTENIIGSAHLLEAMTRYSVPQIIFSSSAAVYGEQRYSPVDEKHPTIPTNYYGFTKLKVEEMIQWYARLKGVKYLILRYFNVAGDGGLNYVDPNANNIFPVLMEVALGKLEKVTIFGNDYDTPDGTGIRDYIDVNDLVDAHLRGLDINSNEIINLGTTNGSSVLEIIKMSEKVTKRKINVVIGKRRPGDPVKLIANFKKANEKLNWEPKVSLEKMVESTWKAYYNRQVI